MAATQRLYDTGTRRAEGSLGELGQEFRHARLRLGLSQQAIARSARVDRGDYSRIERAKLLRLSVVVASRIAAVLGLDLWVKAFPAGKSLRDAGHARRLQMIVSAVGAPLRYSLEVPLPDNGRHPEQRAWDVVLYGHSERTAVEFEARLYDLQAQLRRFRLKRRDDRVDHLLIVVADTRANRRAMAEFADLLGGLPRLRTASVFDVLRAGRHPPTGHILIAAPPARPSTPHQLPKSPR